MRFPYYLTVPHVETLALMLSEITVGAHKFRASISYDGRSKVNKPSPVVGHWEIAIGGKKIPALTNEQLDRVQAQAGKSFESSFNDRLTC